MECIKIVLCIDYKLFVCYNKHKSFGGELEYEYCKMFEKDEYDTTIFPEFWFEIDSEDK